MEGGPTVETRGTDFARPATQVVERLLGGFFVGAIGGVHDHASVGKEDRRTGRGRDGDRETAGPATLQHRVMTARKEAFPGKREPVGTEAREVR